MYQNVKRTNRAIVFALYLSLYLLFLPLSSPSSLLKLSSLIGLCEPWKVLQINLVALIPRNPMISPHTSGVFFL